jgi:flagellar protein FlbT
MSQTLRPGLRIRLNAGEKMIINGAVVENLGPRTQLRFHNHVSVIRASEAIVDPQSPATRICFALQNAYLFPDDRDQYLADFRKLLVVYVEAAPSAEPLVMEILGWIRQGNLYKALTASWGLIEHEKQLYQACASTADRAAASGIRHDKDQGIGNDNPR